MLKIQEKRKLQLISMRKDEEDEENYNKEEERGREERLGDTERREGE